MVTDSVEWKASIQYAIPGWVAIFLPRRRVALSEFTSSDKV